MTEGDGRTAIDRTRWEQLGSLVPDPTFLREVATAFADESEKLVGLIETALQDGDLAAAESAAHSLKGSAANIGADQLAGVAGRVEIAAREGKVDEARAAGAEIGAAFRAARDELLDLTGA